jgi:alpha-glucosidase (family GH31 glycosyl hydrolase)
MNQRLGSDPEVSTFPAVPAFDPMPEPESVVRGPQVRFTVLTSRLLRLEYAPAEKFEDRPSQVFWRRRLPLPQFQSLSSPEAIEIETEHLHLRYLVSQKGFTASTLSIEVKTTGGVWRFGDTPRRAQNLGGTTRTLDETAGRVRLEPGLMARAGWAVANDSHSLVFTSDGWLEPRNMPGNLDLYFFGYGLDFPACLQDFTRLAGSVPLVPRWILGNWWSRYWRYTAAELLSLMDEFKAHNVPLSVCIVDMDWHITDTGNASSGWTGYTWNRELFPDPPDFIDALHARGLKTALNLHPADGIHPHEERYSDFARWMGLDPQAGEPIPFDCADQRFMQGYFELLHHPLQDQGVDFWWLDWQQGTQSSMPGLDPLWWLNHLHFYDAARSGNKRPFIFSRWGGLGNHRYPIGFSGDTVVGWDALDFQPAFTAAAANVGYGWWSHDIGGHMGGIEEDELYARWTQFGVFSPILRLHCTNVLFHERRPWRRGPAAERAASQAMRLRHALIPYIYTMAWRNTTTALPLVTPMYYSHPGSPEAYRCPQEYWFGSELVAAPFTRPAEADTGLARQIIWLPPDDWFNFFTGEHLLPGWRVVYGDLEDIPVFARAGAIVPLGELDGWSSTANPQTLHLHVFPGRDNRFSLYEDDGKTMEYSRGKFAHTGFDLQWLPQSLTFTIFPVSGDLSVVPERRSYRLSFRGVAPPEGALMAFNGVATELATEYDPKTTTLSLEPFSLSPSDEFKIHLFVSSGLLLSRQDCSRDSLHKFLFHFRLDSWIKAEIERQWPDIAAGKMDLHAFRALTASQASALRSLIASDLL